MAADSVFDNIKSFKGVEAGRVPNIMAAFTRSLGSHCTLCHVSGKWAAEDKKEKQLAREMMHMTSVLNDSLPPRPELPAGHRHRGDRRLVVIASRCAPRRASRGRSARSARSARPARPAHAARRPRRHAAARLRLAAVAGHAADVRVGVDVRVAVSQTVDVFFGLALTRRPWERNTPGFIVGETR
jgi:hypothetical protein